MNHCRSPVRLRHRRAVFFILIVALQTTITLQILHGTTCCSRACFARQTYNSSSVTTFLVVRATGVANPCELSPVPLETAGSMPRNISNPPPIQCTTSTATRTADRATELHRVEGNRSVSPPHSFVFLLGLQHPL